MTAGPRAVGLTLALLLWRQGQGVEAFVPCHASAAHAIQGAVSAAGLQGAEPMGRRPLGSSTAPCSLPLHREARTLLATKNAYNPPETDNTPSDVFSDNDAGYATPPPAKKTGPKRRKKKPRGGQKRPPPPPKKVEPPPPAKPVSLLEPTVTVFELATMMDIKVGEVIKYLMVNKKIMVAAPQSIDADVAAEVAWAFDKEVVREAKGEEAAAEAP